MTDHTDAKELHARRASSFGGHAAAYAEHRPDYPMTALDWGLAGAEGIPQDVLDLAAGTGKLTQGLVDLGLTVTAVEPDEGMRAQELVKLMPGTPALAGKAEDIPLGDSSVDAVFVGQALHWFDFEPAFSEIHRVLRPGGVVVALWNHDDLAVDWAVEFTRLVRSGLTKEFITERRSLDTAGFTPFEERQFSHSQRRTIDSLLATVATHSNLLVATPSDRTATLTAARAYLHSIPATATGEFDYPLVTTAVRARRT